MDLSAKKNESVCLKKYIHFQTEKDTFRGRAEVIRKRYVCTQIFLNRQK